MRWRHPRLACELVILACRGIGHLLLQLRPAEPRELAWRPRACGMAFGMPRVRFKVGSVETTEAFAFASDSGQASVRM